MSWSYVRVHRTRYGPLADPQAIEVAIRSAIARGGEFVALPLNGREVRVLVTRGVPVRFETIHPQDEVDSAGAVGVETVVFDEDGFDEWGI